ncbi:MAG: aspartyl protease family protein [Elusimicrobia bacterium]|nr:aspartyl protease family protein [Elusimicrobiota bacterium]
MGEIRVKVRLENERDIFEFERGRIGKKKVRTAEIDAIVDTGAVMILLPRDLVKRLGLRKFDKTTVALADEQRIELDRVGPLSLSIGNRRMVTDCLVGPPGCEPLIGQLVLESLDLIPDPARRTLTPRPESPLRPTLKMKPLLAA